MKDKNMNLDPLGQNHGSAKPYVIGFVLSLVLTIVPYLLVVNKVSVGGWLLETIIGIAVVQLLIQAIFFLHLGRGPTPIYNLFFLISTVSVLIMVVGFSIWIMNNLMYNMMPADISSYIIDQEGIAQTNGGNTGACKVPDTNHQIKIINSDIYPSSTTANRCDSLTIFNNAPKQHVVMLMSGNNTDSSYHPITIRPGDHETITLYQTGDFRIMDHSDMSLTGNITVTK